MKVTNRFGPIKTLLLAVSLFFCGSVTADVDTTTGSSPLLEFNAGAAATGGWSHLTRHPGMILLSIEAQELHAGDAHTLWWIVFNTPSGCVDGCGEDDIFNPDGTPNAAAIMASGVSIGNATGNVVKADGTLEFGARMKRGDASAGGHQVIFTPATFGAGAETDYMLYAPVEDDAEVHVIVQSHGQSRGGKNLLDQLSYLEAKCTPRCADLQFAVHLVP